MIHNDEHNYYIVSGMIQDILSGKREVPERMANVTEDPKFNWAKAVFKIALDHDMFMRDHHLNMGDLIDCIQVLQMHELGYRRSST